MCNLHMELHETVVAKMWFQRSKYQTFQREVYLGVYVGLYTSQCSEKKLKNL
jgi:hypothetical protein